MNASSPARIPTHPVWIVNNSEGSGSGYITLSAATRSSVNCVFARLIWELGADEVAATISFLAGKTAPAYVGQTLHPNGGEIRCSM